MTTALLTIAHGTRDPRGAEEMETLLALLRQRLDVPIANGWLEEFASPGVSEAVAALASRGVTGVVAVPFLNFAAGHAKLDVPAELDVARRAHPQVRITTARVLGVHPELLVLAARRVEAVSHASERKDEVLVVAASGSSDPDANGDVAKAARMLAEGTGHRRVEIAFAGVTWPSIDEVLERLVAAGTRRAVLFSWSLLAGVLERRVAETAGAVAQRAGLRLRDAGRFGPDPLVADVVVERYREAVAQR